MPSPLLRPQARFGAQPAKPALSAEMGGWRVAPGEGKVIEDTRYKIEDREKFAPHHALPFGEGGA